MMATAKLTHVAYCGMVGIPVVASHSNIRRDAAKWLRYYRREGFPVNVLVRGREWEIEEPEDSVLVPDESGWLRLDFVCEGCERVTVEGPGFLCAPCQERADAIEEEDFQRAHSCAECGQNWVDEEGGTCANCEEELTRDAEEDMAQHNRDYEGDLLPRKEVS